MRIYWIKAQAPRRVLALAKHLGIKADFVEMNVMTGEMKSPAYVELNPNKKAPTLVDGDLVLSESSAIMAHLCLVAGSNLWPSNTPDEQIEVLRWLSWGDGHWSPALGPFYFECIVKANFGLGPPDLDALAAGKAILLKFAKVLDAHLDGRDHVACGRLTIVDFQLASMALHWREAQMPLEKFPNITRWLDGLMMIPAWADPWPEHSIPWSSTQAEI